MMPALSHYDACMRTTVTLDDDVEAALRSVAAERGLSFKHALNAVLRDGLSTSRGASRGYRVPARSLGLRAEVDLDLDKALAHAAALEDDEVLRKLALRK